MIIEYDNQENSILRLIRVILSTLNKNTHSTHFMTSQTVLVAKNEHIDKLNNKLIVMFPPKARIFNTIKLLMTQINIIKMIFKQFCIKLCFVMTIKKAQEQIISNVDIYLPHSMSSHDQLYVALFR
ncbi:hypothetical protein Pfo_015302 [Paulownia fortunei]|nr:hypothetical protein Pfo_015302 [Paulownia fortunei]